MELEVSIAELKMFGDRLEAFAEAGPIRGRQAQGPGSWR